MRPVAVFAVSALIAAGTALALDYGRSETVAAEAPVLEVDPKLGEGIAALHTEIAQLRSEVEALRAKPTAVAATSGRREMIDIDAAVRAVLEEEGLLGGAGVAASEVAADEANQDANVEDLLAALLAEGSDEASWNETWKKAKAAGLTDELIAAFEARAAEFPLDAEAQAQLGFAYIATISDVPSGPAQGEWGMKADRAFDRALELDPNHWQARFTKAISLSFWPAIFGKQGEAITNFEILIEKQANLPKSDDHAQTYLLLGNLYQQTGKDEKAAAMWASGAALFPDNAELAAHVTQ